MNTRTLLPTAVQSGVREGLLPRCRAASAVPGRRRGPHAGMAQRLGRVLNVSCALLLAVTTTLTNAQPNPVLWPGPDGASVSAKTSLVSKPPLARSVQTLMFAEPLPDGRNALLVMDFNGAYPPDSNGNPQKPPKRLTLSTETGRVELNDSGLSGDSRAGDGILSGVAKVDRKRHDADINAYLARATKLNLTVAPLFNLREKVGEAAFNLRDPLLGRGEPRQLTFNLPPFGDVTVVATPLPFLPTVLPPTTNPDRTLAIKDVGVVQDPTRTYSPCQPNGTIAPFGTIGSVWSLPTLLGNMSGSSNPTVRLQFINDWLKTWVDTAPPFTVKHSDGIAVPYPIAGRGALVSAISSLQATGWDPNNSSTLDLSRLPFRLLAIFNRIDLAGQSAYGPTDTAELRFVFGLLEKQGNSCAPSAPEMSVILEFAVPATDCLGLKNSANTWIALNSLIPGSAPYNAVLQTLTDQVTPINANPSKLNGSAIGQVRSNEAKLGFPWELREWRLEGPQTAAQLKPSTVKNTPDPSFNNTAVMNGLVTLGSVPSTVVGSSNRYGPGAVPANPPWDGSPPLPQQDRFELSLNTCGGCHSLETGTAFTMVKTGGPLTAAATLAGFLTGITVPDAVYGASYMHTFTALADRGVRLDQIAANACRQLTAIPNLQSPALFISPQLLPHLSAFSPPFAH